MPQEADEGDATVPRRLLDGIMAALVAEVFFVAMMTGVAFLRGKDPWIPSRLAGALVVGPEAVQPAGFVAADVALGLGLHVVMAIMVGVLYAALLPRAGLSPVAGALITGMLLYVFGFWLLPLLFPAWLAPFWGSPADKLLQAIAHAAYGYVFGRSYEALRHRREETA